MAQIKIHQRRIEQHAVQQVQNSADAGKEIPGILQSRLALENGLDQIPHHRANTQHHAQDHRVNPRHPVKPCSGKMGEHQADPGGHHDRSAKSLPGFAGTDARNHLVLPDERPDAVGAHVAELRHDDEVEHVEMSGLRGAEQRERKERDFLHEVQQPRHVHQAEQCRGDGQNSGGADLGDELAETKPENEQNEEAGFKIIHAGRGAGDAQFARHMQEGSHHQGHSSDDSKNLEAGQAALLHHGVKLRQTKAGQDHHDQKKNVIGKELVAGKQRGQNDGPEDDRTRQAAQKNFPFRGRGWRWADRVGHGDVSRVRLRQTAGGGEHILPAPRKTADGGSPARGSA